MAPAVQTAPKGRTPGSPVPDYVVRQVGPLQCRFVADRALPDDKRPDNVPALPTVASIAAIAYSMLPAKADVWPNMAQGPAHYRKGMLAAKPTRDAAKAAVRTEHLRKPTGDLYALAELGPLVTAVRKQLVADVRALFKAQDKADRERQRRVDADTARKAAAARKVVAKATAKVHVAVLPVGARPTKVTAKDASRPILEGAAIVKEGRGASATWWLCATDSYQLTRFPLTIHGDPGLVDGLVIGPVALKAIEQSGALRVVKSGRDAFIQPAAYGTRTQHIDLPASPSAPTGFTQAQVPFSHDVGESHRPLAGKFPDVAATVKGTLPRKPAPSRSIEIALDAAILTKIADSTKGLAHVVITIDERALDRGPDGIRRPACTIGKSAIEVRPVAKDQPDAGIRAVQMLVKRT